MTDLTFEELLKLRDELNRPLVIKYIDKEMPIIIHTCLGCGQELFRTMTFTEVNSYKTFCLSCVAKLKVNLFSHNKLVDFVKCIGELYIELEEFLNSKGFDIAKINMLSEANKLLREIGEL